MPDMGKDRDQLLRDRDRRLPRRCSCQNGTWVASLSLYLFLALFLDSSAFLLSLLFFSLASLSQRRPQTRLGHRQRRRRRHYQPPPHSFQLLSSCCSATAVFELRDALHPRRYDPRPFQKGRWRRFNGIEPHLHCWDCHCRGYASRPRPLVRYSYHEEAGGEEEGHQEGIRVSFSAGRRQRGGAWFGVVPQRKVRVK